MEVIGFTASVLTLIHGLDNTRRILSDYRKGGKDRERLLREVSVLQSALVRLKAGDEKARENDKQEAWLDVVGPLSNQGGALECIDDVISEITLKVKPRQGLRGAMMRWTWPFAKEDIDRNVKQIHRLSQSISLVLQDASLRFAIATNEGVTGLVKMTNKHELRAILQWLSSLNFLEQQRLEFSKAMSGTCDWFLSSANYSAWKQKQQRVLYCSAIGGAGKTILASMAVDDLRTQLAGQDVGIFVIYCKHDRPDTHSVEKLAMAMLRQLVQIKACLIPSDLEEVLKKHYYTNDTKPELGEVLKVLNAHLPAFSSTFIVLDGLDEIMREQAREDIITFLAKLEGQPQIMFTSRPIYEIENFFLDISMDHDIDEVGSVDEEDENFDYWTEYNQKMASSFTLDSLDDEEFSETSSDQDDFEINASPQEHSTSFTPETPSVQSGSPIPRSPLQQSQDHIVCSKCLQNIISLGYQCQKCTTPRSIICTSCYDCGTRCTNEKATHEIHVTMRFPCLKMDVYARPRAIRTYVRRRTQQSPVLLNFVRLKAGFAEQIEEVVTRAAQKMFLLAQLHMDAMSHPDLLKFSEVCNAMLHLPTGLDDSYDKAIDRTQAHGKSLLRLVAYAHRSLSIGEVEQALGVSFGASEILDEEIIPASTLISRCANLVTFDEDHHVVFSHYTIAGYFARRRDDLFGNGHKYMAQTCLNYLNLEEFQRGPVHGEEEDALFDARLRANPFLEYASLFWGAHAEASRDDDVLEAACEFINADKRRNASIQAMWYSSDEVTANWRNRNEASPLHLAMYFRYTQLANRLLKEGVDTDTKDSFGMTSLMWASQVGNMEMTRTLIHLRASLNARNNDGENALHLAIKHRQENIAVLLIDEKDLDINAPADEGGGHWNVTPLMLAIEREEFNVVQKLLARDELGINIKDSRGQSALHRAARVFDPSFMKALGALPSIDLDCLDKFGLPPLIEAATWGNLPAVVALLDAGAEVNICENEPGARGNALMRAADYDRFDVVHELIKRGIDWNAKDDLHRSAIHSAAINGSFRSLAILLKVPQSDINLQDVNGNTPMHDAAGHPQDHTLRVLLDKGAKIDVRNHRGQTPLDTARANGRRTNLKLLMEKYADELKMPKRSLTGMLLEEPNLIRAAQLGDKATVDSILAAYKQDKSMDLEERDDWLGRTPLQHAIEAGSFHIVKQLHLAGASIKVQDKLGRTAIHIAAMRHRYSIARYLLRKGVELTLKDQWGVNVMEDATPPLQVLLLQYGIPITKDQDLKKLLYLAAELGNMKAVRRLIDAGAEVQVKDRFGLSPYERAKRAGKMEMAKYLDQVGKSTTQSSPHLPTLMISSDVNNTTNAITSFEPAANATEKRIERGDDVRRSHASLKYHDDHQTASAVDEFILKSSQVSITNITPTGNSILSSLSSHFSLQTELASRKIPVIHRAWNWNYIIIFFLALILGLYHIFDILTKTNH